MLSTSIADVECKHAQSQHWSDRPFPTMVAKHINAEFKCHKLETQQRAMKVGTGQSSAVSHPGVKFGSVEISAKPKQFRKKPAYMFFRDDWLKAEKGCSHTVNPCTKEFWQTLKTKFSELSPEMRRYYEELESQSAEKALQERVKLQRGPQTKSSQCQEILPKEQVSSAMGINPWLARPEDLDGEDSWEGMVATIHAAGADVSQGVQGLIGDDIHQLSPISEDMLHHSWRRNLAKGVTWASLLHRFNAESQQFAEPSQDTPPFPKRVQYQGSCGLHFCRTRNPPVLVMFVQKMKDEFINIVQSFGPVGTASKKHILLRFDVSYGANSGIDVATVFAWLVAPAAASGIHAAEQSFVLCSSSHCMASGSFEVSLQTLPRKGTNSCVVGCLHHLNSDQFVQHLLSLQCDHDHGLELMTLDHVKINRLDFEDITLSKVLVTGVSRQFETRYVNMDSVDMPGPLNDEEHHDHDENKDHDDNVGTLQALDVDVDIDIAPVDAPSIEPDLFSLVCEDEPSCKRRRMPKSKAKKLDAVKTRCLQNKAAATHEPLYVLDEIPEVCDPNLLAAIGDPSVVASLDSDTAAGIVEAVSTCKQHHDVQVDKSCTFDLDPETEQPTAELAEDISIGSESSDGSREKHSNSKSNADDSTSKPGSSLDTVLKVHGTVPQHEPSSSSAGASSSSCSIQQRDVESNEQETIVHSREGKVLKIIRYKKPRCGNLVCEVREQHAGTSITTPVGRVNLLVNKVKESYKAHCSIRKSCQCWVNGIDSFKLDKLVEWLALAPDCSPQMHEKISKELRGSFGVNVRSW